jgi:nitrogen fixation protein NifQ
MAMAASQNSQGWTSGVQARDDDILTLAFRGVLARFRLRGVRGASLQRFYARYFPDSLCRVEAEAGGEDSAASLDEFDDLVELLLDHRSGDSEETEWLACAVATACFGNNHLWQDMGLPNRAVLSELLRRYFTALHDKNEGNMKWKKFFYKQLCERAHINVCKAPSCRVCSDYLQCFGSEEDDVTN